MKIWANARSLSVERGSRPASQKKSDERAWKPALLEKQNVADMTKTTTAAGPQPLVINVWEKKPNWDDYRDRGPDVSKIIIGPKELDGSESLKISTLPNDLCSRFPNLTHLHLWNLKGLKTIPELPAGMVCVDLRKCPDLSTMKNLPPGLQTLVLENCPRINLPAPVNDEFKHLDDLSVNGSKQIANAWVESMLKNAPVLRKFDASNCPKVSKISHWPDTLERIELNGCKIKSLPARWPKNLVRLGLKEAEIKTALPDLPANFDYLDLRNARSLKHLPALPATAGRPRTVFLFGSQLEISDQLFGEDEDTNVAEDLRADQYESAKGELQPDNEVKVILLGDGRCGKSSICKRLIENKFDPKEKSTHGIRLWTKQIDFQPEAEEGEKQLTETLTLNFWDFAGQDLYHNTHRLFLQNNALYVICGTDHKDGYDEAGDQEDERSIGDDVRRNLKYWIDQVRSLGHDQGTDKPVPIVLVRTKADRDQEREQPSSYWETQGKLGAEIEEFPRIDISAAKGEGTLDLLEWLEQNAAKVLGTIDQRGLPERPMRVKAEIQEKKTPTRDRSNRPNNIIHALRRRFPH